MSSLSLIICTYKRPDEVVRLLDSVRGQTRLPDETIVVDGSPGAETEQMVQPMLAPGRIPGLQYVQVGPEERGLTRQRNHGITRSMGDIVAFLDDDTVLEPEYFAEILACLERHPEASGVGGYITNEVNWVPANGSKAGTAYRAGDWERNEGYRWRLRKALGLDSTLPPGWMPPFGHGRTVGCIPPDGNDYAVEFVMGGASAWRREVLQAHSFSHYFEGYGLYEDLDFCIRAARSAPIYLCTRARLAHYHAPSGRPNQFRYGEMVVRNGWYVWRQRWPAPALPDRLRWWTITTLLTACRLDQAVRGPQRLQGATEMFGRMWGMVTLMWNKPEYRHDT